MKRRMLTAILVFLFLPLGILDLRSQTVRRDPQGVAILQNAIAAHGGIPAYNTIVNLTMTGTVTLYSPQGPQVWNAIRYEARNYRVREEFRAGINSVIEILDNYAAWRSQNGVVSTLQHESMKHHRDRFDRQFWELIVNYTRPQLAIAYLGMVDLGGFTAHRLRLELMPQTPDGLRTLPDRVLSEVFVDSRSALVVKESRLLQNGYGGPSLYEETLFLAYLPVNGALIPSRMLKKIGGNTTREITYTLITANTPLPPDLFSRPR